jgi:hypothetical protein
LLAACWIIGICFFAGVGYSLAGPARRNSSMRITGTVAEWESWAAMAFPQSGDYVVPGALVKLLIEAGLQFVKHLHRNTDYRPAQRFMNHLPHP